MTLPDVVSREEWLAARKDLLAKEKELTRARDALNADRRRLPMVAIDKEYVFEGRGGKATLADVFEGRTQLMIYHAMFAPEWDDACRSCSAGLDQISRGLLHHLHDTDTTYAVVSRAPQSKIAPFRERMGWRFPWYSSYGSDFNYDFGVTIDASVREPVYNFRTKAEHEAAGTGYYLEGDEPFELPGLSCFLRVDETVYHTYSTYARGLEATGGSPYFLDMTALGRQEDWEEPKGRGDLGKKAGHPQIPYPDEYGD